MPYEVITDGIGCQGFAVVMVGDKAVVQMGCHMDKASADQHAAALNGQDEGEAPGTPQTPAEEGPEHGGFNAMKESAENADMNGSVVDVLLISPGTSKNRRRYPAEVLKAAVPLLDRRASCRERVSSPV